MGHGKLLKFAQNETFSCLLQPSSEELLADGYFNLKDHSIKGEWKNFFKDALHPDSLVLELGCGKGEYTVDLASRNPESCYVGVDIKGARLWKGAKYATENKMSNVGFLRTRIEFINAFFGKDEVDQIWLTFSDPQLKSENSRLTSPLFLERYRKFLKPGGIVHLKTDSRFLHEYTKAVLCDPEAISAHSGRATMMSLTGDSVSATAEWELIMKMCEGKGMTACEYYLYHGQTDSVNALLEKEVENEEKMIRPRASEEYNIACMYCRAGNETEALKWLRRSFEHHMRDFAHVLCDWDLVSLRTNPEFQALIAEYKEIQKKELATLTVKAE